MTVDDNQDFSGMTDRLILAKLLRTEGWNETQISENLPELIQELEKVYLESFNTTSLTIIPGAMALLEALKNQGHVLGLITGNLKAIAKLKLKTVGVLNYFTLGAYGDDEHENRSELVTLAVDRAGFGDRMTQVYSIGDTALDVEAALTAGIGNAVGVSNGFVSMQELERSGATTVLENFIDTTSP